MATTIKQIEADTATDAIWARIESYIAHRFTSRSVEWVVEGPGEWCPPLSPTTVQTVEIWNGAAWEAITAPDSPLGGYWLSGEGPYRFTGTIGAGPVPAAVQAAYDRLSAYLSGIEASDMPEGASAYSVGLGGEVREHIERDMNAVAMAMQSSGAADLLRPYRRAS